MVTSNVWDFTNNRPTEIGTQRHEEGFNSIYADGHVKWAKWSQLWYQDMFNPDRLKRVYEGAFDPRRK